MLRLVSDAVADENADIGRVVADDVHQPVSLHAVHEASIDCVAFDFARAFARLQVEHRRLVLAA